MIKNILFDFDGVIQDSLEIKENAFIEIFNNYDKSSTNKLAKYHKENGGMSRFKKIKYFYEEIIKQKVNENDIQKKAEEFASIIERKLFDESTLILDTIKFIQNNYQKYNLHIVSGAEEYQLNRICTYFSLDKYFITIEGSPTLKNVLVRDIINKYNYSLNNTILVGDSKNDYEAAKSNGIRFYGYNNNSLKKLGNYIETFEEISL